MRIRHLAMALAVAGPAFLAGTTGTAGAVDDPGGAGASNRETISVGRGNMWYARDTASGGAAQHTFSYGAPSDVKVLGDWNRDGIDTPGIVRGNQWYLSNDFNNSTEIQFTFGRAGDRPVVGDWNRDGYDTPGVVRGNQWLLNNGFDGQHDVPAFSFGTQGDRIVVGDWDDDDIDEPGVVRGNAWKFSWDFNGSAELTVYYGRSTDKVVTGDWNNDGKDTIGVVRGNSWLLNDSLDASGDRAVFSFGSSTDVAVTHSFGAMGQGSGDPIGEVRQRIVSRARSQIGVGETPPGSDCNPYGYCAAWCAMFDEWVWRGAGVTPVFTTDIARGVGQWGVDNGLFKDHTNGTRNGNPEPGDIVVWGEPGYVTGGHVGVVVAVHADGRIDTVDGNWSNRVSLRTAVDPSLPDSSGRHISGYVRPANG